MKDIDSLEYAEWKRRKINRDVRNTFLVILAIVLALLSVLAAIIADIHKSRMKTFVYGMSSYEADFSAHKEDFELLAEWACGFWEEQKARDPSFISFGMDKSHIWLNYAGKKPVWIRHLALTSQGARWCSKCCKNPGIGASMAVLAVVCYGDIVGIACA